MRLGFRMRGIILAFVLCGTLLAIFYYFREDAVPEKSAHLYDNPALSIRDIRLYAVYAAPKDQKPFDFEAVKKNLERTLSEVESFHQSQFLGKSTIKSVIVEKAVALERERNFYDTDDTRFGNPRALESATLELERRLFEPEGDIYIGEVPESAFRVIAIIYEGLGAAGTEGSLILSRDFISKDEYDIFRSSIFYHELGHAIGIPEGYDIHTNQPFTNDIMGSGRREPIRNAYIDEETLERMGVFSK